MSEDLGATVLALGEQATAFAPAPEGAALSSALRAALDALSRPPERHAVAEQALRAAADRAMALGWSHAVPVEWMRELGGALSTCIGAQPRTAKLDRGLENEAVTLTASSDRPALWSSSTSFEVPTKSLDLDPAPLAAIFAEVADDDDEVDTRAPRELSPVDVFDPAIAEPPVVIVAADVGLAVPLAELRRARASRAVDAIAMHARHRSELPFAGAAGEEERILAWLDAARVQGDALPAALFAWWDAAKKAPDPWRVFSPMLVLGSFAGDDALASVERALSALPDDAPHAVPIAAEALALTDHPRLSALAHDLLRATHPVARAVGVELGRKLGALDPETVRMALGDPCVSVVAAAARACAAPDMAALLPTLTSALGHPHPHVAWETARVLTLAGLGDPLDIARHDAAFAARLGVRVLDLVVMAGSASDEPLMLGALKRAPPSRHGLRLLARFGHPRTWLYLSHYLADDDLADFAADALETIFGALVPIEERTHAPAWRAALTAKKLDPGMRLWRGQPWHPSLLAEEITSGSASRLALEAWGDEIRARSALPIELDLSGWAAESRVSAGHFAKAIGGDRTGYPAGKWWARARAVR
jgi:hypothetical protein